MKTFKSIVEFSKELNTEKKCLEFLVSMRWNGNAVCPYCDSSDCIGHIKDMRFKCRECKRGFSITTGTIYHDTSIPLLKQFWMTYILMVYGHKMTKLQLSNMLGVSENKIYTLKSRNIKKLTEMGRIDLFEGVGEYMHEEYTCHYQDGIIYFEGNNQIVETPKETVRYDIKKFNVVNMPNVSLPKEKKEITKPGDSIFIVLSNADNSVKILGSYRSKDSAWKCKNKAESFIVKSEVQIIESPLR